ncbi:MAG: hypothetical protein WBC67_12570 [Candidatus Acidiferrales bacterium]
MQDEQLENFLREFQPRRPRALPRDRHVWPRRFVAAAAVIAIFLGGSLWLVLKKAARPRVELDVTTQEPSQPRLALLPLTRLALEDPARMDQMLSAASREMLPNLQGSDSTLRVLAKE